MDFAEARRRMVDGQLRPNKVTDPAILEAMREVPRERFLPPALRARSYADEDVMLPGGRALPAPMTTARLIQLAAIRPGDRVLVIGAGTGYAAAVIARGGARVIGLEEDPGLLALARGATEGLLPAGALRLQEGRLVDGVPATAPYDVIVIEGEIPEIPAAIEAQLVEGGRLVAVLGNGPGSGCAVIGRRGGGSVSVTRAFDCATPALPAFAAVPGFVF